MSNSRTLTQIAPATLAASLLLALPAFAHGEDAVAVSANANVRATVGGTSAQANVGATGTVKMKDATSTPKENKATTTATTTPRGMGAENRSAVAARVQALLAVADRDGGIGPEVRLIAQEHASSSAKIEEAEDAVENRPGWLTFLFGSDYGNLGQLRSELVTMQKQIMRLENAASRTTDVTVKADLETQIVALKAQASTTIKFVEDNEDSFSLFGWLVRVFQ